MAGSSAYDEHRRAKLSSFPSDSPMTGLIIDDDPLIAQTVGYFAEKSDLVDACHHASDGASAANLISQGTFDFVLLDLHLPDVPGQALLKTIPESVPVIVMSSDPGFGAESYRHSNIVDYLLKPIEFVDFHRAAGSAARFRAEAVAPPSTPTESAPSIIFVKSGNEILRLVLNDVRYVKSEANYVCFHCGPDLRPIMALAALKRIAAQLPSNFLQTHRSYLVNRDHVERVSAQGAHVGETTIPIGDSFRAEFVEKLGIVA